jgi:CheY-like chemotaxis protein
MTASSIRVLIVDDEPQIRRFLRTSLSAHGYRVIEASCGREALTLTATNADVFWEAELYRQKGELTLAHFSVQRLESGKENQKSKIKNQKSKMTDPRPLPPDPQGEAEACFLKAVNIARQQEAKLLELRAVMSLARLWQQQGKRHAARKTLSAIYNWFTEGLDTKDLQEAKALLAELA